MMEHIDDWGGPTTFPHFAIGWAWAGNTPFQWTKQVASHFGGTRNGMVVHWPKGIKAKGEVRSQFHHVIDVAPTVLEAAKLPEPKTVNGIKQRPMEGVSMLYTFDDAKAKRPAQDAVLRDVRQPRHLPRRLGGLHAAFHPLADMAAPPSAEGRRGSSTTSTRTSARRTTSRRRTREAQGAAGGLHEGGRPKQRAADRRPPLERFNPAIAGRPDLMGGRKSLTVYEGMTGMMENAFINVKGVRHTITAEVEVKDASTSGVIIAQAGHFGGWSLYMKDGKVHHEYNWFGLNAPTSRLPRRSRPASTRSSTSSSRMPPSRARAANRS